MKKTLLTLALAAMIGMPAAHGVDGKTFGSLVGGLAQSDPATLAAHVSGGRSSDNGGMPAKHGVDGKTFGGAVSGLATTNPAGLVSHVSGR